MKRMLTRWIMRRLLTGLYKGVSEYDTLNFEQLSDAERESYLRQAREVHQSTAFQAELQRLRFQQERKLVEKSTVWDDVVWGKATLFTIDLILKRFKFLNDALAITNKEEKKTGY